MSARKIEMSWRCSACDTENKGRFKVCQSCGDPKDASEKFVMPSDTKSAATVTDAELLKKASAGADWRCLACGSNQSALGARCTQCGAARDGTKPPPPAKAPPSKPARRQSAVLWDPVTELWQLAIGMPLVLGAGFAGIVGLVVGAGVWFATPQGPFDVDAVVVGHLWERHVAVEKYALRDFDGFLENRPEDALEVRSLGSRHHHDEQVLDHYDTEYYTEEVADGYDTRYYTEQVACGQDCTTSAPTCSETCSADDNGFATCTESCWGGGETCTTRYCTEQRSEQVARYRTEQRSRQVPRYRTEPRFAEAFAWRAWRWAPDRERTAQGHGVNPYWPEGIAVGENLAEGEQERSALDAEYTVRFVYRNEERGPLALDWVAPDEPTWRGFGAATHHVLRLRSDTEILAIDPPAPPP